MRQIIRYSIPCMYLFLHMSFIMSQSPLSSKDGDKAPASNLKAPQLSEMQIGETSATIILKEIDSEKSVKLLYRDVSADNWLCMENSFFEPIKLGGLQPETNYEVRLILLSEKGKSQELGFCFTTATANEAMNRIIATPAVQK